MDNYRTTKKYTLENQPVSEAQLNLCHKYMADYIAKYTSPVSTEGPVSTLTPAPLSAEEESPSTSSTTESPTVSSTTPAPSFVVTENCKVEFVLYNADEDKELHTLQDLECTEPFKFNIEARPEDCFVATQSARLELSGPRNFVRTEYQAPFFLFGNQEDDVNGRGYIPGNYTIRAFLFPDREEVGDVLAEQEFHFTMSKQCDRRRHRALRGGNGGGGSIAIGTGETEETL